MKLGLTQKKHFCFTPVAWSYYASFPLAPIEKKLQAECLEQVRFLCVSPKDGNFVAVNDNYTQLYGHLREELIGKHFSVVLPDENKKNLSDYHSRFFGQG